MIAFTVAAMLLVAGALLFLVPALLARPRAVVDTEAAALAVYRDGAAELAGDVSAGTLTPETLVAARRDLEHRVAREVERESPRPAAAPLSGCALALALTGVLVAGTAGLYAWLGTPSVLAPARPTPLASGASHALGATDIEARVVAAAARLRERPDDVEGWQVLGRSQAALGRYREAAEALARAAELAPRDPQILADYADALAMTAGRDLSGRPSALVAQALAIDPAHPKALSLAATAAFRERRYADAASYWERALAGVPPGSEAAASLVRNLAEAKSLAGAPAVASAPAAVSASVAGVVSLAPAFGDRVAPNDVVFVYARAEHGRGPPLAVLRATVSDLPLAFVLDDRHSMSPAARLSGVARVIVGARIARGGTPVARPGDLEAGGVPVDVGANGVRLLIDRVVP